MDAHRAEFTCCPSGNAGYFLAARVRYSLGMRCDLGIDDDGAHTDCVLMDESWTVLVCSWRSNLILVGMDACMAAVARLSGPDQWARS
jgi:hypothetical protein